uniref:XRCC4 N-terminal domain-containing protein n=1 Tax=Aegilops tauschii subsp. strangulata TaxID=200361 RepID=A0A453LS32_AEGTS
AHSQPFLCPSSVPRALTPEPSISSRWATMATAAAAAPRHSCAKLSVAVEDPKAPGGGVFVKATWLPTRFSLAVTDGAGAWVADASDAEVRLRAEQWDQPVSEYLALAERYLAFHQPSSTYSFHEAGAGRRVRSPLAPSPISVAIWLNENVRLILNCY